MTTYDFVPRYSYITDVTQSQYAVVTLYDEHDYSNGEIISFRVSKDNGMSELNDLQAKILSHDDDSIVVDIDTTNFTAFVANIFVRHPPMVVPVGSGVIPSSYPSTVNLEDCFDNRRA